MRSIVIGLGIQGRKRRQFARSDFVASVDPVNGEADYRAIEDVALDRYDTALLCVPDKAKIPLLNYLVQNNKHVLVEKPLFAGDDSALADLQRLARKKGVLIYTAYNHRFEPHYVRMGDLVKSGELGELYRCRLFYGNGTARLVRQSAWRDTGGGVLPDLGSHMLDIVSFWFGRPSEDFQVISANRFENRAPDHVVIGSEATTPKIEIEMTLLMWRNHFTCDLLAENGTAHIESLCKWGPTTFVKRIRVLPSGRPREEVVKMEREDPTWALEYTHFNSLIEKGVSTDLARDRWLNRVLARLGEDAVAMCEK